MTTTVATAGPAGAATTSAPDEGRSLQAAAAWSEQLYARHSRTVTGLCRALLHDGSEAEDAAQQTFLSAHRALLNGAEPREPAAWLATIARNECWSRITARMREPLATDAADDVAGSRDPVAEAIARADLDALWRAIRALPQQQRDALLLREFGGLRYDELAVAIGATEPAVESLLFRARARLRAQLRSAYAALTGGALLEPLARLFAGGGAPAVATKVAAVGLGTAAVTGTAVVVPKAVYHERAHGQPHAIVHTVDVTPVDVVARAAAAVPVTPIVGARPAQPVHRRVDRHRRAERETTERARSDTSGEARTEPESHEGHGGGDDRAATTERTTVLPATTEEPLATESSSGRGPGSGDDGSGGGSSGGGSDDSHDGSGSSGSED